MKSGSEGKSAIRLGLLALLGAIGWSCQTQAPTNYLSVPAGGDAPSMIINFEGSPATVVNSNLAEAGVAHHVVVSPGFASLNGGGSSMLVSMPGAAGTGHALSVSGIVTGTLLQLTISLDTNSPTGYYDASLFKGVRFYLRVMGDDQTTQKFFSIPIAQTMPIGNKGTCPANCYDHFGYTYSGTHGQWQQVSLDFSSLKRHGYGGPVTPSTLTGTNLQQFVQLQWQENSDGTNMADFSVDEVQFY